MEGESETFAFIKWKLEGKQRIVIKFFRKKKIIGGVILQKIKKKEEKLMISSILKESICKILLSFFFCPSRHHDDDDFAASWRNNSVSTFTLNLVKHQKLNVVSSKIARTRSFVYEPCHYISFWLPGVFWSFVMFEHNVCINGQRHAIKIHSRKLCGYVEYKWILRKSKESTIGSRWIIKIQFLWGSCRKVRI